MKIEFFGFLVGEVGDGSYDMGCMGWGGGDEGIDFS